MEEEPETEDDKTDDSAVPVPVSVINQDALGLAVDFELNQAELGRSERYLLPRDAFQQGGERLDIAVAGVEDIWAIEAGELEGLSNDID